MERGVAVRLDKGAEPLPGYRLIEMLGEGGFGQVWKAEAPGGFKVALKFIRVDTNQADPELRSLEVIREIRHPFLLDIHFATQVGDRLIIATSLCDQSLLDRLRYWQRQGKEGIPPKELLRYMEGSALGLDYLNEPRHLDIRGRRIGIQHRDIKPHNIFLVGGSVKLADFGLAKVLENSVVSHTGSMTPVYAAPEMFRGKTSSRSDQYSLAVTYYQLRTGRLPFKGNHHEMIYRILEGEPDLSALPSAEREIIARALSKKASERWSSCRAMVKALRQIIKSKSETSIPVNLEKVRTRKAELPFKARSRPQPVVSAVVTEQEIPSGNSWASPLTMREDPTPPISRPSVKRRRTRPPLAIAPFSSSKAAAYQRLWATYLGIPDDLTDSIGNRFALIPPGEFLMGSPASDEEGSVDEHPQHRACVTTPFLLSICQVTVAQFERFVAETGYQTEAERDGDGGWGYCRKSRRFEGRKPEFNWKNVGWEQSGQHPVVNVTWNDAVAFCQWLGKTEQTTYRLPTEVEWEFACRAGTATRYSFGDNPALLSSYANLADLSLKTRWPSATWAQPWDDGAPFTAAVASFQPNAFGLFDMHGNVWEWCADWYDPQAYARVNPDQETTLASPTRRYRVLRGGSWLDLPQLVRSADRHGLEPETRYCNNGFRVARVIESKPE